MTKCQWRAGLLAASVLVLASCANQQSPATRADGMAQANGLVLQKSSYSVAETVARLKQDVSAKGIMFFQDIDQAQLAADAGISLRPSRLLVFGNPPLGSQFMTSNPESGIDWPVRLLVFEDAKGQVWTEYTDFAYIARRHGIVDRGPQFAMASEVIASITSSVAAQ